MEVKSQGPCRDLSAVPGRWRGEGGDRSQKPLEGDCGSSPWPPAELLPQVLRPRDRDGQRCWGLLLAGEEGAPHGVRGRAEGTLPWALALGPRAAHSLSPGVLPLLPLLCSHGRGWDGTCAPSGLTGSGVPAGGQGRTRLPGEGRREAGRGGRLSPERVRSGLPLPCWLRPGAGPGGARSGVRGLGAPLTRNPLDLGRRINRR